VRELEALIVDAVARHQGTTLALHSFIEAMGGTPSLASPEPPEASSTALTVQFPPRLPTLKEAEEAVITEALRRAEGHQGVAAVLLGISRQALNQRLHRQRSRCPAKSAE
jgi:two-component system, NtrC family, nitrogen regulation response regulator GlnG